MAVKVDPNPGGAFPWEWAATGVVKDSSKNTFAIDTCASGSGCVPTLTSVTIESSTLEWQLPVGAFVQVRVSKSIFCPTCGEVVQLAVRNVAAWDGKPNPVSTEDRWYLFLSEGKLTHPDAVFVVSSAPVACTPGDPGELYDLIFSEPSGPATTVSQYKTASVDSGGQTWTVMNVRSFDYGGYDGPPPFAWWATSSLK